jgi:hypothetical protein
MAKKVSLLHIGMLEICTLAKKIYKVAKGFALHFKKVYTYHIETLSQQPPAWGL